MQTNFTACLESHQKVKELFKNCHSKEAVYQKIIELGKALPKMQDKYRTSEYLIEGCQSLVYLHAELVEKKFILQLFLKLLFRPV